MVLTPMKQRTRPGAAEVGAVLVCDVCKLSWLMLRSLACLLAGVLQHCDMCWQLLSGTCWLLSCAVNKSVIDVTPFLLYTRLPPGTYCCPYR